MFGLLSSSPVQAVPLLLNFQGRVTVDGAVFNGTGQFKFALVNDDGTQSYWSNDGSSSAGAQPTAAVTVPVVNGNYSLHLGDTNMDALQASVFANDPIFLRIWFSDGTNGFERLGTEDSIEYGDLNGPCRKWHDNGQLAEEMAMVDGQADGQARSWHPDGSQKAEVTLKTGEVIKQKFWEEGEKPAEAAALAKQEESPGE